MSLAQLKANGQLWHFSTQNQDPNLIPTGYAELDELLGGGWPSHEVVELFATTGSGELRLLQPWLQSSAKLLGHEEFPEQNQLPPQTNRQLVFINPPAMLSAQALSLAGFELPSIWQIVCKTAVEALWTAEQCLKSGCCQHVLLWQGELSIAKLKRLQLSAQQGQCNLVLMHQPKTRFCSLPVALSLQLSPTENGLKVKVLKRRGGFIGGQTDIKFSPWYVVKTTLLAKQPTVLSVAG